MFDAQNASAALKDSQPKKIVNRKRQPQSKFIKAYRKVRRDAADVPKSQRHQEQKWMRKLNKRMKNIQKDLIKEKDWKKKKGMI